MNGTFTTTQSVNTEFFQKWINSERKRLLSNIYEAHDSETNKEENTVKVSYKGMTGELIKLEAVKEWPPMLSHDKGGNLGFEPLYSLEIWDNEKQCKLSFHGVSLKDMKFLGGEVTYG